MFADPLNWRDPAGLSPLSKAAKAALKATLKKKFKDEIRGSFKEKIVARVGEKKAKKYLDEALNALDMLDDAWWEHCISLIPIAGDAADAYDLFKTSKRIARRLRDIERRAKGAAKSAWDRARKNYWKSKGFSDGKAPQRWVEVRYKDGTKGRKLERMELHHIEPQKDGPNHDPSNLMEVWPTDHAVEDTSRKVNYEVIRFLSGSKRKSAN